MHNVGDIIQALYILLRQLWHFSSWFDILTRTVTLNWRHKFSGYAWHTCMTHLHKVLYKTVKFREILSYSIRDIAERRYFDTWFEFWPCTVTGTLRIRVRGLCMTHLHNVLYKTVKFREILSNSIGDTAERRYLTLDLNFDLGLWPGPWQIMHGTPVTVLYK